jgi:hypothetical protein
MDYLRNKRLEKTVKLHQIIVKDKNKLILNIINKLKIDLDNFQIQYIIHLPEEIRNIYNEKLEYLSSIILIVQDINDETECIKKIREIIDELSSLDIILQNNKLNYKNEIKEIQNKIVIIKNNIKLENDEYKLLDEDIKKKINKEEYIYNNEKKRIDVKKQEFIKNTNDNLLILEKEYILMSNILYDLELRKENLINESIKFKDLKKIYRNDVVNQLNKIKKQKKDSKNYKENSKKQIQELNNEIIILETYLLEYPLYKLNINIEYYNNIYKLALLLDNLINKLNIEETLLINVLNNLYKNKEYQSIFNIIFNLESDKFNLESDKFNLESDKFNLESDKFNLESDKFNLESDKFNEDKITKDKSFFVQKLNNFIISNLDKINNMIEMVEPLYIILDNNLESYKDYIIENILEPYKGLYIENKMNNLLYEKRRNEVKLNKFKKTKNILETNIEKHISTKINIKNNFLKNNRHKIVEINKELKVINKDIKNIVDKLEDLKEKINNHKNIIENLKYPEQIINDNIKCNARYNKMKERLSKNMEQLTEEYNNKINNLNNQLEQHNIQLKNYQNIETYFNIEFMNRLSSTIILLNNECS